MANTAGVNLNAGKWSAGLLYEASGQFTLGGAIASADTITFTSILPANAVQIIGGSINGIEFDTNASPTATIIIGDGTDTDGYLVSRTAGGAESRQTLHFDGALLTAPVSPASRNIVITIGGTVATAASSGTGMINVRYICSSGAKQA